MIAPAVVKAIIVAGGVVELALLAVAQASSVDNTAIWVGFATVLVIQGAALLSQRATAKATREARAVELRDEKEEKEQAAKEAKEAREEQRAAAVAAVKAAEEARDAALAAEKVNEKTHDLVNSSKEKMTQTNEALLRKVEDLHRQLLERADAAPAVGKPGADATAPSTTPVPVVIVDTEKTVPVDVVVRQEP